MEEACQELSGALRDLLETILAEVANPITRWLTRSLVKHHPALCDLLRGGK